MNNLGKIGIVSLIGIAGYFSYRKVRHQKYQTNGQKFQLRFRDPTQRLKNEDLENGKKHLETKSKLLHPESGLYMALDTIRANLVAQYGNAISHKRMDYHLELVSGEEEYSEDKLVMRCQEIEGLDIQVSPSRIEYGTNHVAVQGPPVSGYGQTHATIAYFPEGLPNDIEDVIKGSFH